MNNNILTERQRSIIDLVKRSKPHQKIQIVCQKSTLLTSLEKLLIKEVLHNKAIIPDHAYRTLNPTRTAYHHFNDIRKLRRDLFQHICDMFQFPNSCINEKTYKLSTGQLQLLAIMLAWYQNAQMLIASNPFYALDHNRKNNIINILNQSHKGFILLTTSPITSLDTKQILYFEKEQKQFELFVKRRPSNEALIRLSNVSLPKVSISPITASLNNEITGLIGANGSGKTSLAHAILNYIPYQGSITIDKKPVQFMFQEVYSAFNPHYPLGITLQELEKDRLDEFLLSFQIKAGWEELYPYHADIVTLKTLSLARCLLRPCEYLILDEPLSGMNDLWINTLFHKLLSLNIGVLIIDHDVASLRSICNQIYTINNGGFYAT